MKIYSDLEDVGLVGTSTCRLVTTADNQGTSFSCGNTGVNEGRSVACKGRVGSGVAGTGTGTDFPEHPSSFPFPEHITLDSLFVSGLWFMKSHYI